MAIYQIQVTAETVATLSGLAEIAADSAEEAEEKFGNMDESEKEKISNLEIWSWANIPTGHIEALETHKKGE